MGNQAERQLAHQAVLARQHCQRRRLKRADVCELRQRAVVGIRLLQPEPLGSTVFAGSARPQLRLFIFQFLGTRNFCMQMLQ